MRHIRKLTMLCILAAVLLAMLPTPAGAVTFSDVGSHWAKTYIYQGVDHGYISGYSDGTFRPNNPVTRAEFSKMLNAAIGLTATTTVGFTDVASSAWYYAEVQKAVAAGYITGYENNTFRPNNNITRQEAAVVMARIVTEASVTKDITTMKDYSSIASWALIGAKTCFSKGYIAGDNNKMYRPSGNLTRAEAAKIIEAILATETIVKTTTTISDSGKSYSNTIFTGNVVVASGVGNGTAAFSNCRLLGTMLVNGGGSDGIKLANTNVSNLTVNKSGGGVRVYTTGTSTVGNAYASSGCTLLESSMTSGSGFTKVTLSGSALRNEQVNLSGTFDSVALSTEALVNLSSGGATNFSVASGGAGSTVNLASGTNIATLTINGAASFTGKGTIASAVLNVSGSTFETAPTKTSGSGSSGSGALVPTMSPSNGSTNVDPDVEIDLTFSEALYSYSGTSLTSSYAQSGIELRRGSETGSKVGFTATVNGTRKIITITPDDSLEAGIRYYVIVTASAFKNQTGTYNSRAVFNFTVGGDQLVPTVYPVDGSEYIPVDAELTLKFDSAIYKGNGSTITVDYIATSVIELRRNSATGSSVSFEVELSTDKKTITIIPDNDLQTDTKYYILLKKDSIAASGGKTNAAQTFSFTTADTDYLVPVVTPASGSTGVSTDADITLTFSEKLYDEFGDVLTAAEAKDAFTLRKTSTSGSTVTFSASISTDKKTITLSPSSSLTNGTKYYLTLKEGYLYNSNDDYNEQMVFSFTVGGSGSSNTGRLIPTISPANGATGVSRTTSIKLTFDEEIYDDEGDYLTASYMEDYAFEIRKGSETGSTVSFSASINSSDDVVTLKPDTTLTSGTKYYVIVVADQLEDYSGNRNSRAVFYFTAGSGTSSLTLEPSSTTPDNGDTGVSTSSSIKIYFDEEVYDEDGDEFTSSTLKTAIYVYKGSVSTSNKVTLSSASINSGNDIITLSPGTMSSGKYYVVIREGYLTNDDGDSNDEYQFSFTVGSSSTMADPSSTSPADGATKVSASATIKIYFDENIYNSSGNTLTASYMKNTAFSLYKGSVSSSNLVDFTASISSNRTVTLTPSSNMSSGKYYVVIHEDALTNSSDKYNEEYKFSFTVGTSGSFEAPSVNPSDGATGVSTTANVVLTFDEKLYRTSSGTALTSSGSTNIDHITSYIKIRKGSSGSNYVDYTPSLNSTGKILTLSLDETLEANTKYYVVITSGKFYNEGGYSNSSFSSSFTTRTTAVSATMSPSGSNVSIPSSITLNFGETIYGSSSKGPLSNTSAKSAITIYQGAKGSATTVSIGSASVSGSTITLSGLGTINPGTTYTVVVASGKVYNASGTANSELSYSFTTAGSTAVTMSSISPASGNTNASIRPSIVLTFNSAVSAKSGTLAGAFSLKTAVGGTNVSFAARAEGNTVILTPDHDLDYDTQYTVGANAGALTNAYGGANTAISSSFTTKKPSISISTGTIDENTAEVTLSWDAAGAVTLNTSGSGVDDNYWGGGAYDGSANGSKTVTVSGLSAGRTYTLTATLTYNGNKTVSATKSFTTYQKSTDATLKSLRIGGITIPLTVNQYSYEVSNAALSSGSLAVSATASSTKATVGDAVITGEVAAGGSVTVDITVTAENGETHTYTVSVGIEP